MSIEIPLEIESDHGGDIDWVVADLKKNGITETEISKATEKLNLQTTAMYRGDGFFVTKYFDNYYSIDYSDSDKAVA